MSGISARLGINIQETADLVSADPQDFSLDPYVGYTYRGKMILNQAGIINQIDAGRAQDVSDGVITYAFFDFVHALGLNNNPSFGEGRGYTPFSETQKDAARISIGLWDDLIAPAFVEAENQPGASAWGKKGAVDIWLANTTTGPAQAWAYYPGYGNQYTRVAGDTWIASPEVNWTNEWFTPGGYGNTTLIHELGHSVGMSHPGAYNGAGATTYLNQAEYAQDSMQYSIMSYWSGANTGNSTVNWIQFLNNYAQTPMLHDILTAQAKYGADPTTRTGDTTYGFNSNADRDVFDFNLNGSPYLAIYDAGGNDTIDLSGYTASNFINLHAGSFSSVGQAIPLLADINAARAALSADSGVDFAPITQATVNAVSNSRMNLAATNIASETGVTGIRATQYDNLSIAYGVTIENAIGGSARDVLWGNAVANRLEGRGGDDVLNGYEGADDLYGGAGNDTFQFSHLETGDEIYDWNSGDKVDLRASVFGDLTFVGNAAFTNTVGELRYDGGILSADTNGDGVADFSVALLGSPAIVAGDLLFI